MPPRDKRSLLERIAARVVIDEATGCHVWQGGTTAQGYGSIGVTAWTTNTVHRVVWIETFGAIPDEARMDVHHRCENRLCCNPAHLELLTPAEHSARHHKPYCKRGHPLVGDNLYVSPGGQRKCRACRAWRRQHGSL